MTGFSNALLKWYSDQEIEMPWRNETDPYRIWLSEVMLQQTQIQTVKPYYIRWIKSLPTVKDAAGASEDQVLKLWEGLGYYARARNFRHACQMVFEKFEGEIPSDPDQFRQLKGVGDYITAAVQSIVFGHPIPVIDGNVRRLTSRLLELSLPPSKHQKEILEFLELHIGDTCPGDFNQAMMDLAREVCKPKKPLCNQCPVSHFCTAFIKNTVDQYPVKEKRKKRPHYHVAVGIIWKNDFILVSKRKSNSLLGGLWEFPGGKLQNGESSEECIKREIWEELGIGIEVGDFVKTIRHEYTHFSIMMDSYHCLADKNEPEAIGCADWKWIPPRDVKKLAFPKANHKIFDKIPEVNPFDR